MIQNLKKNKLVILTTHSMEEADALGDKVAIMAKGQLKYVTTRHLRGTARALGLGKPTRSRSPPFLGEEKSALTEAMPSPGYPDNWRRTLHR